MKNTLKVILALAMVLCMLFTIVGCDNGGDTSSEQVNSDFFEDEVTQNQNGDTTSDTASDGNGSSGNQTTYVPEENKIGGKTWKEVVASMPKKLSGTTVVMYNWNPAVEYTGAPAAINAFTKATGIKVDWKTVSYAQYYTKLPALISSGENIPDMARLRGPHPDFVKNFQPITVAKYDFTDEAWDKNIMDLYTFGSKTYAVSLQNTHVGSINVLFYNKTLINKHDFDDPYKLWKKGKWTWSKYIKMCKEFNEITGNPAANGEGGFGVYLTSYGISGSIKFNGSKYSSNMSDKQFIAKHELLAELYTDKKLFEFGGQESFNDGSVLFSIGSAVHARQKNPYFGNLKASNTLCFVPMPSIDGQKKYYQGHGEAEAYGIPKGAKNPQAVPYFLRYFLDGANYELSTYFGNKQNLEVYNWCMNQKNKVYAYGYPDEMDEGYYSVLEYTPKAQMNGEIKAYKTTVDKWVKEYNEEAAKLK